MSVQPEAIAAQALLDYLRRQLPAKVATINASRYAVLTSALAGPFTIPVGATLRLSHVGIDDAGSDFPLTDGVRTAAQVAAEIGGGESITASADDWGRLVLTSEIAPASGQGSAVIVKDDGGDGTNAAFGWNSSGEHVLVPALVSPSWRGVVDGWPLGGFLDMGPGFWVVLGDRTTTLADPNPRKNLYNVAIRTEVWCPFSPNGPPHRTREAVSSALRCVRELLESDDGRYLGRQATNDVQMTRVISTSVDAKPSRDPASGLYFDIARLNLTCRVFQRPD